MSGQSLTCLFWVRDVYLPLCRCTAAQAHVLLYVASFADPDGSSIFASDRSVAKGTRHDRRTVQDAFEFWEVTGALIKVRPGRPGRGHGPEWRIPVPWRTLAPQTGELHTRLEDETGDKRGRNGGETGELHTHTVTDTEKKKLRTPLPPVNGGPSTHRVAPNGNGNGHVYLERYSELVEIEMGKRRRLPNMECTAGGRADSVVSFLRRNGFAARIVPREEER
jgi:hypothetical protein